MAFLRTHRSLLLLLVFYLVASTLLIDRYPRVWVDEPWESVTAATLVRDGRLSSPLLEGRSEGWYRIFLEPRILLSLCVAPSFLLFGVGILQARFVSVLFGVLLVLGSYLFGARLFSRRAGLITGWLVAVETMVFIAARTVRPEIYLAALEVVSLLFYFTAQRDGRTSRFFVAGILTGITLWTHPNALLHACAMGLLFLVDDRSKLLLRKSFWVFVGGAVLAFLPYAVYVALNDAANGFATFWAQLAGRPEEVAKSGWIFASLRGEWGRFLEYTQFPYRVLIVAVYLWVIVAGFCSKDPILRRIILVCGVYFVLSVMFLSNKTIVYSAAFLPLLGLIGGKVFDDVLPRRSTTGTVPSPRGGRFAVLLFVLLSLNEVGGSAYLLYKNRDCSYHRTITELQSAVPKGARVWGSITFWFGFSGQPYRTQYTFFRDVASFQPEYLILGDREVWSGKPMWSDVRARAEALARKRGELVREIPTHCYGDLRVYRIVWR